ncbi:MAG: hypothetical protein QF473_38730 [Planctomycetota bacterium]|jgi:hypothetical protein|nr:hypothetical protein [Planctomycetota bacterium]
MHAPLAGYSPRISAAAPAVGGLDDGHFIVDTSPDGFDWDEGTILQRQTAGAGAYSNNLPVHNPDTGTAERLLIQASHAYHQSKTNIYHWWLT